ncbi:MAG: TenA family transcriptional regulator [Nitrososphaerales archaeon]
MDLVKRIDLEIEKRSLLKHPFYQMWSEGRLEMESLRGYAKEYFHLVRAVPEMVESIAQQGGGNYSSEILRNLSEERDHIEPWVKFAGALGVAKQELEGYQAAKKTKDSVQEMLGLASRFEEGVSAMYAYEAEIPKISRTKLDGLGKYYGITGEDATEYQRIHAVVDVRHADVWRRILGGLPGERHERVFDAAVSSLVAQNTLLDAVYERYVA